MATPNTFKKNRGGIILPPLFKKSKSRTDSHGKILSMDIITTRFSYFLSYSVVTVISSSFALKAFGSAQSCHKTTFPSLSITTKPSGE